jgi:MFS family permease
MLLCALIAGIFMALIWLLVHDKRHVSYIAKATRAIKKFMRRPHVFRMPQVWLSGLFAGLLFAPLITFAALWCVPYLLKLCETCLSSVAWLCSLVFIGAVIGSPVMGWFSNFINRRKLTMQIGVIITLSCMLIIVFIKPHPSLLIAPILFFLGFFSSVYLLGFAMVRDILPEGTRGVGLGFVNMMCMLLGGAILQPFIGWILGTSTSVKYNVVSLVGFRYGLEVIVVCLILGLIITFFIRETLQPRKGTARRAPTKHILHKSS